jgi:3-polyprenyl-4-hydroxybenzoate decarboxylase
MKPTKLKISISQDGLLPQETADITTLEFPSIPKKLLKALGFERVDSNTFVGVLPVFVNLLEKDQEIEFELGVNQPEMRKRALEIIQYKNPEALEKKQEKPEEEKVKKKSKRGRKPKSKTKVTE